MGEKYVFHNSEEAEAFEKEIAELVAKDEAGVHIANPDRFQVFRTAYEMVRSCVGGNDVNVKYGMNEPFPSTSYITIEGKSVITHEPETLMKAMRMASNIEIYALTDGNVCIDLAFHSMTRKAREE